VLETLSKLRMRLYIMLASVFNILSGGSMVALNIERSCSFDGLYIV